MNIKLFTNIIKQFRDSKVKVSYVFISKIILVENGILIFFYQRLRRFRESNSRPLELKPNALTYFAIAP